MLDNTQLDSAKKLCELLLWQYPDQVDSCFAELQDYLGEDNDVDTAFRMSVDAFYSADWNELDFLLSYLVGKAKRLEIPVDLAAVVDGDNTSDAEDFFPNVSEALAEHGFDLWWLDTGMAMHCICVTPQKLRKDILEAASTIGLGLSLVADMF